MYTCTYGGIIVECDHKKGKLNVNLTFEDKKLCSGKHILF